LDAETALSINVERWFNTLLSQHDQWQILASMYYQVAHGAVTLTMLCVLWWWHPRKYRDARNALIGTNVVALIIFWLLPVAPPRLLPDAGFVDSGVITGLAQSVSTVYPNQFAAMPSLHVAWAVWVALQVMRITPNKAARCVAVAYPVVTSLVVIATGNHFVLDVVAGAALAFALVWWAPILAWRPPPALRERVLAPAYEFESEDAPGGSAFRESST